MIFIASKEGMEMTTQQMQRQEKSQFIAYLRFALLLIFNFATPQEAFCQMYGDNTTYSDYEIYSGGTIHAWATTYAPSGNQIMHTYETKVSMAVPWGAATQQTGSGSGYSPARADAYLSYTVDDLLNDREGNVEILGYHDAFCPMNNSGLTPFFSQIIPVVPYFFSIRYAILTSKNTAGSQVIAGVRFCNNEQACANTSTPICGGGGSTTQETDGGPCCGYYKSAYAVLVALNGGSMGCTPGVSICWIGPGYCTPAL
jgi:hypothetical protein